MTRAIINPQPLLQLSTFDFPLMLQMKLPVVHVGRIQPQSRKFAMSVENKATGYSKLHDSSDDKCLHECA